jgi:hypothetical protein
MAPRSMRGPSAHCRPGSPAAFLLVLLPLASGFAAAGCRSEMGCTDGTEKCKCRAGLTCNAGLTCYSGLCVNAGVGGAQAADGPSPADDALASVGAGGAGGQTTVLGTGGAADTALPSTVVGVGGSATGGSSRTGQGGVDAVGSVAVGGAGGAGGADAGRVDANLLDVPGGGPGAGGSAGRSGATWSGGTVGSGGAAGGGGGLSSGGVGGCSDVVPCGGDVVGVWTVTSSCLTVSGSLDLSNLGIGCMAATVTGTRKVSGTWTGTVDGKYSDKTRTTGTEQLAFPASCLQISGTIVPCESIGQVIASVFGYAELSCGSAAIGGGCTCSAIIDQNAGVGMLAVEPPSNGKYTTSGNSLTVQSDTDMKYSYCASGNQMTWTPQSTSPTISGTIVFQNGGAIGSGGSTGAGGGAGKGGGVGSGGAGGSGGSGGTWPASYGPCDIYAADGGPCVAAHSTVRRLVSNYIGPLYQVRAGGSKSGTGGMTTDVGFGTDGFADGLAQDSACGSESCTISVIYDQSGRGNHLTVAPAGGGKVTPDNEADAKALPITISGHKVYGVHITPGTGYRNNRAVGTALADDAETIYMVTSGDFYNAGCCFDYGNAEIDSRDRGEGAMEAVYFGNCMIWNKGAGDGPWVMADLENGLWAGDSTPYNANQPVTYKYVTGMVKGDVAGANHWSIKVANAQSGRLTVPFDGVRPSARYNPMRKEGAIVLGTAGDNSAFAQGNFFEGVMTAHYASDPADDAVQSNIVAGYRD